MGLWEADWGGVDVSLRATLSFFDSPLDLSPVAMMIDL
jgi:hypothetical protein